MMKSGWRLGRLPTFSAQPTLDSMTRRSRKLGRVETGLPSFPRELLLSCVLIKINAGALRPGSSIKSALFRMGENQFSETIYSPQSLNFVVGYAMKGISHERTRDGAPRQVTLIENGGVPFVVNFKDGESIGMPVFGDDMIKKLRVFMVDANGWSPSPPAASSPTPPSATPTAAPATPSKTASARPPIRTGHTLRLRRPR
jgi:hypothetical protein